MATSVVAALEQLCLDLEPEPGPGIVLLVGATEPDHRDVSRALSAQGFEIRRAKSAGEALRCIDEGRVALLVTGGRRSRRTGDALLTGLEKSGLRGAVPLVWLGSGPDDEEDLLRRGASLFLRRPVPVAQLVSTAMFAVSG